jgi:hypothetical protein
MRLQTQSPASGLECRAPRLFSTRLVTPDPVPQDLAHLHRPRWLVPLVALGLVALVLGAIAVIPPSYRYSKKVRAEKAAAKAEEAMKRSDWEVAGHNVRLAIGLGPQNPAALRVAARLSTLAGNPNASQYWQMFLDRGQPTRDDRVLYARLLLRMHRTDLARQQIIELLKADAHDPEAMELSLSLLLDEGRAKDALVAARAVADEFPNRPGAELSLARVLLHRAPGGTNAEAHRLLWNLAFGTGPDAFSALTELSRLPDMSPGELKMLRQRAPDLQTNALLAAMVDVNLQLRLEPKMDLEEPSRRLRDLVPTQEWGENRLMACDWLLNHLQPAKALELCPTPASRTNAPLLQRRLQALANLNHWDEISTQVEDPDMPLETVMRNVYRAIVATHREKPEEAATHLSTATAAAGDQPEVLEMIAGYAESLNQPALAAEALQRLLSNPTLATATGPRILRLLNRVDRIPPLLLAMDRLLQFDPNNDVLRNDQAWFRLLAGEKVAESTATAAQLSAKYTNAPRYAATLGLGWLRQGTPERAYDFLESLRLGETNAPLRARLVLCASMGAAGRRDAARRSARLISTNQLRSEERLLIEEWLDRAPSP